MIYWIVRVRLNHVCSLETKSCLSCYPVRIFFQRAKVLPSIKSGERVSFILPNSIIWYHNCVRILVIISADFADFH
jgi:hypothetical protein